MIQVDNLSKSFAGGQFAVNALNLDIKKGEIFALLGPNGAGKTTTIRVLTTLAGFDSGHVVIAGHNVDTHPELVRASIGLVAQQTGVDFLLTGRENLTLQGHLYHLPKVDIKARINELASYFELNDALDKQVMTYSGGMRRKLDIATALIHKPQVLFLDEPTLGLDIKSRKSLWHYVEKLNKELDLTILLTTHYLEEADILSDRVGIINNGKICVIDTAENLKSGISGDAITLSFESKDAQTESFAETLTKDGIAKHIQWRGNNLHIYVEHGASAVPKVVSMASEAGLTISELSLAHPTLDDVFLRYTGNTLTDSGEEEAGEEWWHQWAGKGGGSWGNKWKDDDSADEASTSTEDATTSESNQDEPWRAEQEKWAKLGKSTDDWQKWQNQDTSPDKDTTNADAQTTASEETKQDEPAWKAPQEKWGQQGESDDWKKWQKDSDK